MKPPSAHLHVSRARSTEAIDVARKRPSHRSNRRLPGACSEPFRSEPAALHPHSSTTTHTLSSTRFPRPVIFARVDSECPGQRGNAVRAADVQVVGEHLVDKLRARRDRRGSLDCHGPLHLRRQARAPICPPRGGKPSFAPSGGPFRSLRTRRRRAGDRPLEKLPANLFFQLVGRRYERDMLSPTNQSILEWARVQR